MKRNTLLSVVMLFVTIPIAISQADTPTTKPAPKDLAAATSEYRSAVDLFNNARGAASRDAETVKRYVIAKQNVADAEAKVENVKASGTREDRANAASAVDTANQQLQVVLDLIVAHDPRVVSAAAALTTAEADVEAARWTDMLDQVNPKANSVSGDWAFEKDYLVVNRNSQTVRAQILVPTALPETYDLRIEFSRTGEPGGPFVEFPVGPTCVMLELDRGMAGGRCSGLSKVRGEDADQNKTRSAGVKINGDKVHVVLIGVRHPSDKYEVAIDLDGVPLIRWSGRADELSPQDSFTVPDPGKISLATWTSRVTFTSVRWGKFPAIDDSGVAPPQDPTGPDKQ